MDHNFGYVYVLTNPSIPGQVKIGRTQRRPERRGAELSAATGVPQEFELYYYRSFPDCTIAERIVHSVLEEQGLRTAANREFFSLAAPAAKTLIDEVGEKLETPEASAQFAQTFVGQAQAILLANRPGVSALEEALTLLEHATSLAEPLAPYLAGETIIRVLERRKSSAPAVREGLVRRGQELFETAGERGVLRGYAQAADLALALEDTSAYVRLWDKYLSALSENEDVPQEELDFVLAFMEKNMFSGPRAIPPAHPYLKANSKTLRRHARAQESAPAFCAWVDEYVSTREERLLEKLRMPLLILAGVALVCVLYPGFFITALAAGLLLLSLAVSGRRILLKRRQRRDEKKRKKRKR